MRKLTFVFQLHQLQDRLLQLNLNTHTISSSPQSLCTVYFLIFFMEKLAFSPSAEQISLIPPYMFQKINAFPRVDLGVGKNYRGKETMGNVAV